jgi:hypothetical protein
MRAGWWGVGDDFVHLVGRQDGATLDGMARLAATAHAAWHARRFGRRTRRIGRRRFGRIAGMLVKARYQIGNPSEQDGDHRAHGRRRSRPVFLGAVWYWR